MLGKQFTLAIFKPELVENTANLLKALSLVQKNDFIFAISKKFQFSRAEAERFYSVHEGKYFHERLMQATSRGPVICSALFADNAIQKWRHLIGPTDVEKARIEQPECLRAIFGITETLNCFHGSDSVESAERELGIIFPDFDRNGWVSLYGDLKQSGRKGQLSFDEGVYAHKLIGEG